MIKPRVPVKTEFISISIEMEWFVQKNTYFDKENEEIKVFQVIQIWKGKQKLFVLFIKSKENH